MKRLIHIIIYAAYKEGWGYQENILPIKHSQLGYDVHIITYNQEGRCIKEPSTYINNENIKVHILKKRNTSIIERIPKIGTVIKSYRNKTIGLYDKLVGLEPDIIFVHGVGCYDYIEVAQYVKEKSNIRLYVDNHCDYYNNPVIGLKGILIRHLGSRVGRLLASVSNKMWGVTPWRVLYLQDVYSIPKEKCGLLVMGGDESKIDFTNKAKIRAEVRERYNVASDTFLIITGGKIDRTKNIHCLAEAVNKLSKKYNIRLLVFGKYDEEMGSLPVFKSESVINVGWIESDKSYELFLASDLAVFPGTHSVLWEQACAAGIPGIFKDWDGGVAHIDVGGNVVLLKDITVERLIDAIESIVNTEQYNNMKSIAEVEGRKVFSYIEIAKRSIEYDEFEGAGFNK